MITIPKSTVSKRLNTNRPICKMISGFLFVSDGTQDKMLVLAHATDCQTNTMLIGLSYPRVRPLVLSWIFLGLNVLDRRLAESKHFCCLWQALLSW